MATLRRSAKPMLLAAFLVAVVASVCGAQFLLSDQSSEVYYRFAAVAGKVLQMEKGTEVFGNLHSNGEIRLKKGGFVEGDVSASGKLRNDGTVTGEVTPDAEALAVPELLDEAALRALADRVFEEKEVTFTDEVIDDVVFVPGKVRIVGSLNGVGTLIATRGIRVGVTVEEDEEDEESDESTWSTEASAEGDDDDDDDNDEDDDDGCDDDDDESSKTPIFLDEDTRVSLISLGDIRLCKDRPFRGVLRAGRDVTFEKKVDFQGVVVADRRVHFKRDSRVRFVDFDQVAPTIELLEPTDGSFVTTATPRIELASADDFSGVRAADTSFSLDGIDRTAEAEASAEGLVFVTSEPLPEGSHSVEAVIFDHSDNEGRGSFSFIVDTVPPTLTFTSPGATTHFNNVPPIVLDYADATSGVALSSLAVAIDGVEASSNCTVDLGSATCAVPALGEGTHTVAASIADRAGNEATASFTFDFVIDVDPPVITVTAPADGATLQDPSVTVTGTVSDKTSVASVTVDGQAATLTADEFTAIVGLEPGPNTIVVEAVDVAGNTGSVVLSVTLATDTTPPNLTFLAPPPGIFLAQALPEIEVSFSDDDSGVATETLTFTANGLPLPVTCSLGTGEASCLPDSSLPDAVIDLVASLDDQAGNTATALVRFTVDTVGVEVTIDNPLDGLVTRDAEVQVSGVVGLEVATVRVNALEATVSAGRFSATVPLREGTNMLVALATKNNGNTGAASVEVTRDIQAPIVKIDSPRDGFAAVDDVITITGLVNDVVTGGTSPLVRVNGIEAMVANGAFLVQDLELSRGPNVIEAVATDSVGNENRDTITVSFQLAVGARLRLESGNGQFDFVNANLSKPLVARVEDDLGNPVAGRVVRFEVTRNSGTLRLKLDDEPRRTIQVPTDGSGQAAVLFTLGDTAGEGNNRVRATALGVAGEVGFCASALAAPADKILMVNGDNQRGLVANPLPLPLESLVVDPEGNPADGVEVTFEVVKGFGSLDGQRSLMRLTGIDGMARAMLTLGPDSGINNNVVIASFPGHEGLPASFTASGLLGGDPAQTRFSGVVLDNAHTPIPGALVQILGTGLGTFTDNEGQFLLEGVPVGHIHPLIDPTGSPRPEVFPPLAFETVTVAGQNNTLGMPILIPVLDTENSTIVGGDQDVTLTMKGVEGLSLTVLANSVTFPDGAKTGRVTISQVHLDKVPMPPPNGTLFMPPAWTIQPAGVVFDPPARITIPNNGLPPGRMIDIFQFDHAVFEFISIGKGTVSEDGFVITSDPGFGITRAGWGGGGPPPPDLTDVVSGTREDCPGIVAQQIRERDSAIARGNAHVAAAVAKLAEISRAIASIGGGDDLNNLVICLKSVPKQKAIVCLPEALAATPTLLRATKVLGKSVADLVIAVSLTISAIGAYTTAGILNDVIVTLCALADLSSIIKQIRTRVEEILNQLEVTRTFMLALEGDVEAAKAIVEIITGSPF